MIYSYSKQIPFHLSDPAGVLFFGNSFHLAHECLEQFLTQSPLGWKFWFKSKSFLVPIVNCNCDFKSPLFCGESYSINLVKAEINNSSIKFHFEIIDKNNSICIQMQSTHVFISKDSKKPITVPEQVKKQFS